jgi:hypothetical protein
MSKGSSSSIPSDYTFKLGSDGSTIHIDTDLDNIHIKEIAPVTVNSNLAVTQPIVTQSTSKSDSTASLDLKIEPLDLKIEPIKADVNTNSLIDLKPVAVDSCTTIKLAPLPPIRVEQPYSQHFGFTYMGMELFGFTMSGKSEMFLHSPPKPQYQSVQPPASQASEAHGDPANQTTTRPRSGLRVRIGDNH